MERQKIHREYLLNATSKSILWSAISTPTGLEGWFADRVQSDDKIVTFFWGKTEHRDAEIIAVRAFSFIRFRWLDDEYEREYFELKMTNNEPATIDFAGPNGMSIYHATQIRYEHALAKGLKAGIGVEMPVVDGLTNEHVSIAKQRMPNFPVYVQYGWNPKSHFRAAAIIRSMTYDDLTARKAESEIGWGVLEQYAN